MKLLINEKFLWDLYNLIEKVDDAYAQTPFPLRTMKEVFCPDLYELRRKYEKKQGRKNFSKLISYLKRRGLIRIKELEEKKGLLITQKGKDKILKIRNKLLLSFPKKKRKDGKWLMVAFDIPEKRKGIRNYFREKLIEFGFQNFQKSIWISPFDVLKEVQEIIRNLGVEKNVRIFLIEETQI
ncbi:MAG: CRISPR-associated endonuclease Cas2 [Candidatus Nealsonbacteria bacterium CG23_combo_of_CG06-09_8_20_14_all_36_12]|uniref:CRISPR-associated endonuclease Cas2 n=1 Tax=Candidatus Nealsonbacteria bacterium CG23_combo_of_CG06-09_8_20_14_all_36_12 TaxID=1974718 RepID=A0A2G9Z080_9BACT|nr:MAG: CRISPR-associated endonuclease Cas2 [Candidatus Nealsonbacteria bacterium CG23_combo_of_CG06-09_8_20_14_all_36_12]